MITLNLPKQTSVLTKFILSTSLVKSFHFFINKANFYSGSLFNLCTLVNIRHICRMDDTRAPKQLMHGELVRSSRPDGRPKLRFKDTCKNTLKCEDVLKGWQSSVNCRQEWRSLIETVCGNYTKKRVLAYGRGRALRREKR